MSLKSCKRIINLLNVLACGLAVAGMALNWYNIGGQIWLFGGAVALLLAGLVLAAKRYNCPYCGARLPVNGSTPNRCPDCHHLLEE